MKETCLNLAIVALIVFVIMSVIRAVSLRSEEQAKRNAILGIIISVVGIGFILAFQYARMSIWHYLVVGGALVLIHRELQNRSQACMSIYGNSRKYRLAFIVGTALGAIAFIHAPWVLRPVLVGLMIVVLLKRQRPRPVTKPGPEPYFGGIVKLKEETPEEPSPADTTTAPVLADVPNEADPTQVTAASVPLSPATNRTATEPSSPPEVRIMSDVTGKVDAEQVTASYAHPTTGMAHTDAALQVYVSSEDGPAKSRARRIIVAGLTKTAAFKTEDEEINAALKDVVTGDLNSLKERIQALPERLKHLAETEADGFDAIRHKVLTVLNIVQIIAEDPHKQYQVRETELRIRTMDADEQAGMQDAELGAQDEEVADDPDLESDDQA